MEKGLFARQETELGRTKVAFFPSPKSISEKGVVTRLRCWSLPANYVSFSLTFLNNSYFQVSVDTMAITALPLETWLKERLKNWVQLSGHEGLLLICFVCIFYFTLSFLIYCYPILKKLTSSCVSSRRETSRVLTGLVVKN